MSARKSKRTDDRDEESSDSNVDENEENNMCEDEIGGIRIGDIYIPPAPRPACTLDTTGPRLIITHIENENFKSYAGKIMLGPLHKSFTSIVGPNGSGKSNVIDSMLFVFGYRATKIRSKKISVLLHNSEEHQNIKSCTVTVNFHLIVDKPGEDFEVVPNSRIAISRTAFKDNSSFYTIDGRKVQFKEVAKLLQNHGIDLDHNRFLILQGEVEQIAMMKPIAPNEHESGMLEYLEDIIGTTRFKEPLQKLSVRVEQLTEERADKLARVKMVEKERDALEEHKNEAIKYLKFENEVTEAKNEMFQFYILKHQTKIDKQEEEKKLVVEAMDEILEQLARGKEKKDLKDKELKEKEKLCAKKAARKEELRIAFEEIERTDMALQEDIKQTSQKRKKTKGELKQEKEKLQEIERIPEKNLKSIEELIVREETLSHDRKREEAAKDQLMAGLAVETKGLKESKDKLENELIGLKKTVDETKAANNITKKELELYLSNEQKERTKLEQINTNYKKATELISARKPQIEELNRKIPSAEELNMRTQTELSNITEQEKVLSGQLRSARMGVEETRSSMHAKRSSGKVLDFLMKQRDDGKIPGIYGRLGDLGAIDQKYDIAVSTAVGPLDYILVDTAETGQQCIQLLKQYDVGRANFIVLNKQEALRQYCDSKLKYPENALRLFDLIKIPNADIRTAFYFACRETLVADDLDQASRIGYGHKRYRMVTLKGEMIELSGTMSGGGRPSSGRMGRSVASSSAATPGQLDKMERKLEELESRSVELRGKHDTLQARLGSLPTELRAMKMDLKKFTAEIQSALQQEPVFKEQLVKQKEKVKEAAPNPAQVKKLEAAVEKTQAAFDDATAAAAKIESKVNKLHAQIMEMTGGRVAKAQEKLDGVTKMMEKVRQEITKLKVAIKTSERNSKKSTEKIANMEQEISGAETNLISMNAKTEKLAEKGNLIIIETKSCNTDLEALEDEIKELKADDLKLSKGENEIKASKLEIAQKLDAFNKAIDVLVGKLRVAKSDLKGLKLHILSGENGANLKVFSEEELQDKNKLELVNALGVLESQRSSNRPDMGAIEEYRKKEALYMQRLEELEKMNVQRNEMRNLYEELRKKRLLEFHTGYNIITNKLKEMYQMITLGGDAELELVDSLDPFSEGVIFSVRPPKKTWKNIANLSGGEKTLSSLALVFALHYYKPSPLYVMDEIDAALDFKNVSIVGNYIKERTKNAQFIIISLRANMFELADRLIGIYKTHNATKSATINPLLYGKQCSTNTSRPQAPAEQTLQSVKVTQAASQKSRDQHFDALLDQCSTLNVLPASNASQTLSETSQSDHKRSSVNDDGEVAIPRKSLRKSTD